MQLNFNENCVTVWILESPELMRKYIEELKKQSEGEEGNFVLSEDGKLLDISKQMELLLTPFEIDVNEKKCINKLCAELKERAFDETHYLKTQQLFADINNYFLSMEMDCDVDISCGEEVDFVQLIKAAGIKAEEYETDFVARLEQYSKVMSRLLKKKLMVFVNLSSFLEKTELEQLLQQMFYLKMHVCLIEFREIVLDIPKKCYIIDKDKCEIY